MRLLNTKTLYLEEFLNDQVPKYAILSHRWQEEELSFKDMKRKYRDELFSKPGYAKVRAFSDVAYQRGYEYCWVDTCCIDKRSSAELSEAINSMYHWYEASAVCYAYLEDLQSAGTRKERETAFVNSEWLVAPVLPPLKNCP